MANGYVIKNARLVNEGRIIEGDLRVQDGRIAQVGGAIPAAAGDQVMDAAGRLLMPGMIDDQVHFREPGLTHKADIRSESRAALAGGITSFMEMPNTKPQTVSLQALEEKFALAADRSFGNYAFYLGATNDNLEELRALEPGRTCGIKVFMGASTGNMLVNDEAILERIFAAARVPLLAHCEDTPTIERNEEAFRRKYGDNVPARCHPEIRSAEACYLSSSLAVRLARRHGTRLHVLHLTSSRELSLFDDAPLADKRITAEVCVHHLYFADPDYEEKGHLIKCNPAIKYPEDRRALQRALVSGRIDVVGTDHAPHTLEEKGNPYFKAPSGLPLVQHAVPLLLELYHDQIATLELLVEKACHAPAQLFGVQERGYLREGYWADLVLVDLNRPQRVQREDCLYKCGWSPLEGRTLRSSVAATFVNGHLAYDQGRLADEPRGMRLAFAAG
jgi:dihydroorotase